MRFPITDLVVSLVPLFALFYCVVIFLLISKQILRLVCHSLIDFIRISIDLFFQIQIIKLRNKGKKEADVMNVFHVYKSVFILFTSVKF